MGKSKKPDPESVSAAPWTDTARPRLRTFPGPRGTSVPLRVALSRAAYGEITGHAQGSLEREVCGVLVGEFCEDDEGPFVDVQAAVRGAAAREERGHVTFTHETWNSVHATLDREHRGLKIVGWYHTHPGFGVELSEMDSFIQKNFFPLPQQIALVMDPLGGDVGLAMNGPDGVVSLDRFWVDGRERRARVAARDIEARGAEAPVGASGIPVAALETRVSQLIAEVHELRESLFRFLTILAVALGVGLVIVVGYAVKRTYFASVSPPREITFARVPVLVGGRPSLLGVQVVTWEIPEEMLQEIGAATGPTGPSPVEPSPPAQDTPRKEPSPGPPGETPR